jgi:hypothetical protein
LFYKISSLIIVIISIYSFSFINETKAVASVRFKAGSVSLIRSEKQVKDFKIGSKLYVNDLIETKNNSRVEIELENGSIIKVTENSLFRIDKSKLVDKDKRNSFSLLFGKIFLKVKKLLSSTDEFSIKTPTAVAAIRGTEFSVHVSKENIVRIKVKEGSVDVGETSVLRNFDDFAEWLKGQEELFELWKNKENGKDFFEEHIKLFEEYKNSQEDAFERFKRGEDIRIDENKSWLETVSFGEEILIDRDKRIKVKTDDFKEFE